ncbi:MAG: SNF2-related protein, partial [Acetobacteraceae bacterium]
DSGALRISGTCSCPVGHNCKHLAAVLIAVRRQQMSQQQETPSWTSDDGKRAPPRGRKSAPDKDAPLPLPIADWLSDLQTGADDDSETYPASIRNRVLYVLSREAHQSGVPALRIQPFTATLRKSGGLSSVRQLPPHHVPTNVRFLRPSDKVILSRLARRAYGGGSPASDDDPDDTLRRILATGRTFWNSIEGPQLREGAARPGQITWDLGPDGLQRASLALDGPGAPVRAPTPWYVDADNGEVGQVSLGLPASVVVRLLAAPPIPSEAAARVRAEIARRLPSLPVPAPNELAPPKRLTDKPVPHLRLLQGALPADPQAMGRWRPPATGLRNASVARLSFRYGPVEVPSSDAPQPSVFAHEGTLYQPRRDHKREHQAHIRLSVLGFDRVSHHEPTQYRHAHSDDFQLVNGDDATDWFVFVTQQVPELRQDGWIVDIDPDFQYHVITPDSPIDAWLDEGSGIDWLELHLGVMVDGERVDLVPALLRMISQPGLAAALQGGEEAPILVPLADGRQLAVPRARIRPTLQALIELFEGGVIAPGMDHIRFTRHDAANLAELESRTGLIWRGGEGLRTLGRQLQEAGDTIPQAALPRSFRGTLRPYQQHGVDWLQFLRSAGLGGVLADDMGLGKTIQTLAHVAIEKAAKRLTHPALIVCPTSLIPNWLAEAAKFAPRLRVLPLHGPTRKERFADIPHHDVVLTTYPLLARDHEVLTAQEWHILVLDEAQSIKNPNAETTQQALRLKAEQRICLSGTPLQNHLGELWSLFDFLAPGFLGNQKSFRARYRIPIEKHGDEERSALLTRRVRPFLLRRTKEEVVKELPPKTEITERIALEEAQQAVYEGIRLAMHARVKAAIAEKGLARSGIIVLDALLKLRQACCDPRLLKMRSVTRNKAGSAKLERLSEMLSVMLAEDRRVLVFSQFTEMLALIANRLKADGIDFVTLTGETRDRATPVRRFQAHEVPVFLISLKAGGVGLNLTAADTVIHYDPWWNPAVEDQATDRAYRIGQTRSVFVHRLITQGTIEEKMEVLKDKKRALVASVMEAEHGGALKMTEADVEALFAAG